MKPRAHMMDRFRTLSAKHQLAGTTQNESEGTWDIQFSNKVTLRVTNEEYEILRLKIEALQATAPEET